MEIHSELYELFHYRDREKREIDLIVERRDQSLLGIEIKASLSSPQKMILSICCGLRIIFPGKNPLLELFYMQEIPPFLSEMNPLGNSFSYDLGDRT